MSSWKPKSSVMETEHCLPWFWSRSPGTFLFQQQKGLSSSVVMIHVLHPPMVAMLVLGSISLAIFQSYFKFDGKLILLWFHRWQSITTKFCTCLDRAASMSFAKFCIDLFIKMYESKNEISIGFGLQNINCLVKWAPVFSVHVCNCRVLH